MCKNNYMQLFRNILQILIIASASAGILIEFLLTPGAIQDKLQLFSYYTIQTNILAIVGVGYILIANFLPAIYSRKSVEIISLSLAVWLFVTFAGYHFLLSGIWFPSGIRELSNILLHYITPGLVILNYLSGKRVLFKGILILILYPFLYVVVSLIRGALSGFYPYFFLSPLPAPDGLGSIRNVLFFIILSLFIYLIVGNLLFVLKSEKFKDDSPSFPSEELLKSDKMPRTTIFYFSGTGNTAWIAKTIEDFFKTRGADVKSFNIENLDVKKANDIIKNYDICGFGYPIYGSDLPQIVKDFISHIDNFQGKKAFVFCTQWLWSGDGAAEGRRYLKIKGFDCLWGEHFLMPNNICITQSNILPFTNNPKKINRYLRRNLKKCNRFVSIILNGEKYFKGSDFLSYFTGYYFQRVYYKKYFGSLRNDIGFDKTRCTGCGKCIKMCPINNLVQSDESGEMSALGKCILCVRCYNYCPESAITYRGKPYNLNRGIPYRGPKGLI